jgi:hypothetical protein
MVDGNAAASSSVILAPALEMFCTMQCRAANPPSSVIHAGCLSDLRVSRFLDSAMMPSDLLNRPPIAHGDLMDRCID